MRRKKASKGRVIRVSDLVFNYLEDRKGRASWDCLLRKTLGLPDRLGRRTEILEGWVELNSGRYYADEADARGAAVVAMAKRGTKRYRAPIRVKESL